ncbi:MULTISPECIES: hypothetical protein [Vitreoscilla]|uniref:Uncharacterized protein n=1 Tax=Vitreoscilla stercoraria TaxID=61 RepID=A0ABY4EBG2_VITST|nr:MULTISPECIES: hypothetical protein [Vitreoscilla]AUZ05835.1 hypothetical protein ADP71_25080 [Vitreoscilla sp. C1]UOO92792.1 hypothetical protein LVJ81_01730 [Vitreoscilla stercoraria]
MKLSLVCAIIGLSLPVSAWALSQQDVDFANRQCAQRQDPQKCQTARDLSKAYNEQQRNRLEYDAAVRAGQPMQGSVRIETNVYGGDNRGAYHWNSRHKKYCHHNSDGSVFRCY